MTPLSIILLVLFVIAMALWAYTNLGSQDRRSWVAFFAVLILGIVIFLTSTGVIVVRG